jgi:hypothetical protein
VKVAGASVHLRSLRRDDAHLILGGLALPRLLPKVGQGLDVEEWRDNGIEEVVEPDCLVRAKGLQERLVEESDWPHEAAFLLEICDSTQGFP